MLRSVSNVTRNNESEGEDVNAWPSQKHLHGIRLKIHTWHAEANILYMKMFTIHPHTWSSSLHLLLCLIPSIYSPPLSRTVRMVSGAEEAVIRPSPASEHSKLQTQTRDEREQLPHMLPDIHVSLSIFLLRVWHHDCVRSPPGCLWYYQWCGERRWMWVGVHVL